MKKKIGSQRRAGRRGLPKEKDENQGLSTAPPLLYPGKLLANGKIGEGREQVGEMKTRPSTFNN